MAPEIWREGGREGAEQHLGVIPGRGSSYTRGIGERGEVGVSRAESEEEGQAGVIREIRDRGSHGGLKGNHEDEMRAGLLPSSLP